MFGGMNTVTLGEKLGLPPGTSPLIEKARGLGLSSGELLEALGVARGCRHYNLASDAEVELSEASFSNEELAIALLSPELPYSPRGIRIAANLVGAAGNRPRVLAELATAERAVEQLRYIANAGHSFEPQNSFWPELLSFLPESPVLETGIMPHPTRFVSMTGMTRNGVEKVIVWLRPLNSSRALATANG